MYANRLPQQGRQLPSPYMRQGKRSCKSLSSGTRDSDSLSIIYSYIVCLVLIPHWFSLGHQVTVFCKCFKFFIILTPHYWYKLHLQYHSLVSMHSYLVMILFWSTVTWFSLFASCFSFLILSAVLITCSNIAVFLNIGFGAIFCCEFLVLCQFFLLRFWFGLFTSIFSSILHYSDFL